MHLLSSSDLQISFGKQIPKFTTLFLLIQQIKIVVKGSTVKATSPDVATAAELPYPLKVPAMGFVSYFEERQPFNIIGYLKTPYGAMIAFMIGSMVLMPMLKVDPEEYKEMVEEKKKLTSAISGKRKE